MPLRPSRAWRRVLGRERGGAGAGDTLQVDIYIIFSISTYIYKLNIYSIREFGELSEGETHLLVNNNPIHFSNGTAMMLTLDCGVVCGQVSRQNWG